MKESYGIYIRLKDFENHSNFLIFSHGLGQVKYELILISKKTSIVYITITARISVPKIIKIFSHRNYTFFQNPSFKAESLPSLKELASS